MFCASACWVGATPYGVVFAQRGDSGLRMRLRGDGEIYLVVAWLPVVMIIVACLDDTGATLKYGEGRATRMRGEHHGG